VRPHGLPTPSSSPTPTPVPAGRERLPAPDPATVRITAAALPTIAFVAGIAVPTGRRTTLAMLAWAGMVPLTSMILARASRRATGPAPLVAGGDAVRVVVVIPARNEVDVIGALVGDLLRSAEADGGRDAFASSCVDVVIVDDASTDGTGDRAAAALAAARPRLSGTVVRLPMPSGSKGAALGAVPNHLGSGDLVVVLDADARVGTAFLARCRAVAAGGTPIAQARRRMLRPVADPGAPGDRAGWLRAMTTRVLVALQDGEFALDDVIQRGRLATGGASELRGDGMLISGTVLAELGGWPRRAVCEDLDLSSRWHVLAGRGVERPGDLDVWEQPVLHPRSLLRQRLRWAEGAIRRDLHVVLPALARRTGTARQRLETAVVATQTLAPLAVAGLAIQARVAPDRTVRRRAGRTIAALAGGYWSGSLLLAWESQRPADPPGSAVEPATGPGAPAPSRVRSAAMRLGRSAAVATFTTGLWAPVTAAAWCRMAVDPRFRGFARTPHAPSGAFSVPEPDPLRPT
jgi:hypothetical protein